MNTNLNSSLKKKNAEPKWIYDCPSLQKCSWEGSAKDFPEHFQKDHPKLWTDEESYDCYVSLSNTFKQNVLVVYSECSLILQYKTDPTSKKFWCGMRYIGEAEQARKFRYVVNYCNVFQKQIQKSGLMQLDTDWEFDEDLMMEIDLHEVKAENCFHKFSFSVDGPKPNNLSVSKLLLDQLKCLVCQKFTWPPVFLCQGGHTVCSNCKTKNGCSYKGQAKCGLPLLDVSAYVQYPCKNQKIGRCDFIGTAESVAAHIKICLAVPSCLVDNGAKCNWKGKLEDFWQHLSEDHPQSVYHINKRLEYNLNGTPTYTGFISSHGAIFKIDCKADSCKATVTWTCQQINLKPDRNVFCKLEIEFIFPNNPKKGYIRNVACCKLVGPRERPAKYMGVKFEKLNNLLVQNKVLLKYRIVEMKL